MCHPLVRFKVMTRVSFTWHMSSLSHNHKLGPVRKFENNPNPDLIRNSHRARLGTFAHVMITCSAISKLYLRRLNVLKYMLQYWWITDDLYLWLTHHRWVMKTSKWNPIFVLQSPLLNWDRFWVNLLHIQQLMRVWD